MRRPTTCEAAQLKIVAYMLLSVAALTSLIRAAFYLILAAFDHDTHRAVGAMLTMLACLCVVQGCRERAEALESVAASRRVE